MAVHVKVTGASGAVTEFDVDLASIGMTREQLVDTYAAALAQERNAFGNYRFKQSLGANDDKVFNVFHLESIEVTGA